MAQLPNTRMKQDMPPKGGYPEVRVFFDLVAFLATLSVLVLDLLTGLFLCNSTSLTIAWVARKHMQILVNASNAKYFCRSGSRYLST